MMRIKKFDDLPVGHKEEALRSINVIRAAYPWSTRAFTLSGTTDLYLVLTGPTCVGFIECSVGHLDLALRRPATLYLHELHIASTAQRQGFALAVLDHLMSKGLSIEMVVANENGKMLTLMEKLGGISSSISQNTRTITLPVR